MKVCYFGTYRANYSRNQIMIAALRAAGVEVVECHAPLWRGVEDRVAAASGKWASLTFIKRFVSTYWQLLGRYRRLEKDYDLLVLGYPGQIDVFLARLLAWLTRKPLVMDVFMSIYLIAAERGLVAKSPFTGRLIRQLESWACRLPDRLVIDTVAYRAWFEAHYNLPAARFRLVPTGADDRVFKPVPSEEAHTGLRLIHYGTYLPGTGVDVIIDAAKLLENEADIHFDLLGEGQFKAQSMAQAVRLGLKNVTFHSWIDKAEIPVRVAEADVCLGVFARAEQSERTVVNKAYEALAMAKPLITGDSATVRDHIAPDEEALLVERGNPQHLAQAILRLRDDPALRRKLAERGHALYQRRYAIACLGEQYRAHLEELLAEKR